MIGETGVNDMHARRQHDALVMLQVASRAWDGWRPVNKLARSAGVMPNDRPCPPCCRSARSHSTR
jgi:hypothetical protein